jgi:hypothetical protein
LSAAPATTSSILVAITGVLQDPSTYSVSGTTLTFSPAPPTGTGNISVRFLGIPASGVTTTAYRTVTEFTATSGQTTFNVPSYTPGFIDVYQNGVLLGSADYTASSGLTVVLAIGATVGDLIEVISFQVSSVLNAMPTTGGTFSGNVLFAGGNGIWNTSGNVGVGTTSPLSTAMLEVSRGTTVIPTATVTADNQVTGWRTRRTGGSFPREYYMGIRENSTALDFYDNTADALRMRIDASGRFTVPNQPAFFAGINAASDTTYSINNFVPFNITVLNTGNNFNTGTNRFTAPVAGRYFFSWQIFYTNSAGATYTMQTGLNINGGYINFGDAFVSQTNPNDSGPICFGASAVINLSANDVVGIMVRSANIRVYQGHCNFSGYLVG